MNPTVRLYTDPVCILSCARDHARETLRSHAAQERLVSHWQLSVICPLLAYAGRPRP